MRQLTPLAFLFLLLTWSLAPLSAQDEGEETTAACPATLSIGEEAELFASIRHYGGILPADVPEINAYAQDVFLPLLIQTPGFRFYATMNPSDGTAHTAVNVFTSVEEMRATNELAAAHVSDNIVDLLPIPPEVFSGPVQLLLYANHCPEMSEDTADTTEASDASEDQPAAFLGIRVYTASEEDSEVGLETINALIREKFAPIISESSGFILYLTFLFGDEGGMVTLNLFASREEMIAANAKAAEFVAAELAEVGTAPPASYGGTVAVLDLSGLFAAAALDGMDATEEEASEDDGGG